MSMINQAALATAVVNIVGNTQGLDKAIGESQKRMRGFMVFAQAMGGKTGGMLANMFSAGGAHPFLTSVMGNRVGGGISTFLQNRGILQNPVGSISDAMDRARRQYDRDRNIHRLQGANIQVGAQFQGRTLQDARDVRVARVEHSRTAPKLADFMERNLNGVAEEAQQQALMFGKLGLYLTLTAMTFKKLAESGAELDRQFRKASNVFGRTLQTAMGGYGGFGSNMSRSQYIAGASGIGQQLAANGVGTSQSSGMTANMARGAGRLAQMWSAQFEDVAGKIASAIGGSENALQQYGIVLDENLVRANAYNKGMIRLHETMSEAVASQSRYQLIMAQIDKSTKDMGSGFFDLNNQWNVFTSNLSSSLQTLGSYLSPVAAGLLGIANAAASFLAKTGNYAMAPIKMGASVGAAAMNAIGLGGTPDPNTPGGDRQAMLARAAQDSGRVEDILRRERARQSSNVGYHSPDDFYQHIQKGIFGDPVEFAKRQADMLTELVVVSKEQLSALRDFGYKAVDATALLKP